MKTRREFLRNSIAGLVGALVGEHSQDARADVHSVKLPNGEIIKIAIDSGVSRKERDKIIRESIRDYYKYKNESDIQSNKKTFEWHIVDFREWMDDHINPHKKGNKWPDVGEYQDLKEKDKIIPFERGLCRAVFEAHNYQGSSIQLEIGFPNGYKKRNPVIKIDRKKYGVFVDLPFSDMLKLGGEGNYNFRVFLDGKYVKSLDRTIRLAYPKKSEMKMIAP